MEHQPPTLSKSAAENKRRRLQALEQKQIGKGYVQIASSFEIGPGLNARLLLIEPPKKNSKDAPYHFKGFIYNERDEETGPVKIIHSPSTFETKVPEIYRELKRPPLVFPEGSFIEGAMFKEIPGLNQMTNGDFLYLRGVRFGISPSSAELKTKGLDEDNVRSEIVLRKQNDPVISITFGQVALLSRPNYDQLCILLGKVKFASVRNSFYLRLGDFMRQTPDMLWHVPFRADVRYEVKGKPDKVFIDAMMPFQIPNELIYSHGYPNEYTAVRIRNAIQLEDIENDPDNGAREIVLSLPDSTDQDSYFRKDSKNNIFMIYRGPNKNGAPGMCLDPDVPVQLQIYEKSLGLLGVQSLDLWQNICTQLCRGLDALCAVRVDIDSSLAQEKDDSPEDEFAIVGTAEIIRVHYLKTLMHAGLKVSLKYLVDKLTAKHPPGALQRHLVSSYDGMNNEFAKFISNARIRDTVQGFFLNEVSGEVENLLSGPEWSFFFVPPSADSDDGTELEILRSQNFYAKNSQPDAIPINEAWVTQKYEGKYKRGGWACARLTDNLGTGN